MLTNAFPGSLTYLDLSGNTNIGNSQTNEITLGRAFSTLSQLRTLTLSYCGIGSTQDNGTIAIGNGLHFLPHLQFLDLSGNGIGSQGDNGTVAIGNGLRFLPDLQTLDLSGTSIGNTAQGTVAIGNSLHSLKNLLHLDLFDTEIGNTTQGISVIGDGLSSLFNLRYLGLSLVSPLSTGEKFGIAIGNALPSQTNLTYLDLSLNSMGEQGDNGTIAVGEALPFLKNLLHLDLSSNNIGSITDNDVIAIGTGLGFLTNLTYLDLSSNLIGSNRFSDNGTVAIGNSLRSLNNLLHLDLWNNAIGQNADDGALTIGSALPYLSNLQYLGLSYNDIGSTCTSLPPCSVIDSLIGNITQVPFLTTLNVQQQGYDFTPAEMTLLAQYWNHRNTQTDIYTLNSLSDVQWYLNSLPNDMTTVSLPGWFNPDDPSVVEAFMKGLASFPLLRDLDLSNNNLGDPLMDPGNIIALGKGLAHLTGLQSLNLAYNNMGWAFPDPYEGIAAITDSFPYLANLTSLNFFGNFIGSQEDNATIPLGKILYLTNLQSLNLGDNNICQNGNQGIIAVSQGLSSLTKLQSLHLGGNGICQNGSQGVIAVSQGLSSLTKLQSLDLRGNYIGQNNESEAIIIGKALSALPNLTYLNLETNGIAQQGEEGTISIGMALKSMPNLANLNLAYNQIGNTSDAGTAALAEALHFMPYLQVFDISNNPLGGNASPALYSFSDALSSLLCQSTACDIQGTNLLTLPWDKVSTSRGALYSSQIQQACEANQCFGTPVNAPTVTNCLPAEKYVSLDSCSPGAALTPPLIFKLLSFSPKREQLMLPPPLLSEDVLTGGEMVLFHEAQVPSLWESVKERFGEFQPSSIGLFCTSATKGAAYTFGLEMVRDVLEHGGVPKRAANMAVMAAQVGMIVYTTASYMPTVTGMAVNGGLIYMGAPSSVSSALGNIAAVAATSIAMGVSVTPKNLALTVAGGAIGSALALKAKNKISSWLWKNKSVANKITPIPNQNENWVLRRSKLSVTRL